MPCLDIVFSIYLKVSAYYIAPMAPSLVYPSQNLLFVFPMESLLMLLAGTMRATLLATTGHTELAQTVQGHKQPQDWRRCQGKNGQDLLPFSLAA